MPLMSSQQSSFSGIRTALIFQVFIAWTEAASFGPSDMPHPWTQAYSVPMRFTPCSATFWPSELTSLFACTCRGSAAPAGTGAGVTVGAGVGVGVAAGAVMLKLAAFAGWL